MLSDIYFEEKKKKKSGHSEYFLNPDTYISIMAQKTLANLKKEKYLLAFLVCQKQKTSPKKVCIQFNMDIKLKLFLTLYVCVFACMCTCIDTHTHIFKFVNT